MSAFSQSKRRILSLWLPRLPIDRIKRKLACAGSRDDNASEKSTAALVDDISHGTGGRLSPPTQPGYTPVASVNVAQVGQARLARGRAGEGGNTNSNVCGLPPSLTSRASFARLGPRKGGGDSTDIPSIVVIKENNALQIYALDDAAAKLGLDDRPAARQCPRHLPGSEGL